MSFQSLYRTYRPQRFGDLIGQDSTATALRNAVRDDRVGHAYLFSGPRGTGKTSSARILAKALNCHNLSAEGEPCGVCDACVDIGNGTMMDVIELDAASNNSVSDVRDLLEGVHRVPSGAANRKVYIIDEVHMLSTAASNALLKTLEEPPAHAVFVLATTDPQKVLPTIRSRTQHFPFTLVSGATLTDHLVTIAADAGITADRAALERIAQQGAGSVRDALSALDQARAFAPDGLDEATVAALYSKASFADRAALIDAVIDQDGAETLAVLTRQLDAGTDARALIDDLLAHLRDAVLVAGTRGELPLGALPDERSRLNQQARRIGADRLLDAISLLGDAVVEMRRAPDPRLVLEVALLRLANPRPAALFDGATADGQSVVSGGSDRSATPGPAGPAVRDSNVPSVAGGTDTATAGVIARLERRIEALEATVRSLSRSQEGAVPGARSQAATGPSQSGRPPAGAPRDARAPEPRRLDAHGRGPQAPDQAPESGPPDGPRAQTGDPRQRGPHPEAGASPDVPSVPQGSSPLDRPSLGALRRERARRFGREPAPTPSNEPPSASAGASSGAPVRSQPGRPAAGPPLDDGPTPVSPAAQTPSPQSPASLSGPRAITGSRDDASAAPHAVPPDEYDLPETPSYDDGDDGFFGEPQPAERPHPAEPQTRVVRPVDQASSRAPIDPTDQPSRLAASPADQPNPARSASPVRQATPSRQAAPFRQATGGGPTDSGGGAPAMVDRNGQLLRTRPASAQARVESGGEVTLDNAVLAWPQALARLDPRLQRRAAEAQPIALEGNEVVLGLRLMESNIHHDSIRHHQADIEAALTAEIGQPITLKVVTHGGYTGDGPNPARLARAKPQPPKDEQLASIERLKTAFDAQVESEVHKSRAERNS